VRMLLVDGLAQDHRWAQAIALIMPIANDTHPTPQRDAARAVLAKLQAEAAKAAASPAT